MEFSKEKSYKLRLLKIKIMILAQIIIFFFTNTTEAMKFDKKNIIAHYQRAEYGWILKKAIRHKKHLKGLSPDIQRLIISIAIEEEEWEEYIEICHNLYYEEDFAAAVLNAWLHNTDINITKDMEKSLNKSKNGVYVKKLIHTGRLPYNNNDSAGYRIFRLRKEIINYIQRNKGYKNSELLSELIINLIEASAIGFKNNYFNKNLPAPDLKIKTQNLKEFVLKMVFLPYFQNQKNSAEILLNREVW